MAGEFYHEPEEAAPKTCASFTMGKFAACEIVGGHVCRMRNPNSWLYALFNPWVLAGTALSAVVLSGAIALWIYLGPRAGVNAGLPTAVVTIIPAPTSTQPGLAVPIATPTPTLPVPASPLPGVIQLGAAVEISGTGGEGLNLRAAPGLDSTIRYLGVESEVFIVQDGPQEKDGILWWYLVGFFDESRSGWAAANYLKVIQNP